MMEMKKILTIGVILLFIGVAVAPSINFTVVKASDDNDLVEVTTQACGIKGYRETMVLNEPSSQLSFRYHWPIWIEGNKELTQRHGIIGGNGTQENPYIISGWRFNGVIIRIIQTFLNINGLGFGIVIMNTDKYIRIQDNLFFNWKSPPSTSSYFTAIYLFNVTNVTIENNIIKKSDSAIRFEGDNILIRNNTIFNVTGSHTIRGGAYHGYSCIIENNTVINCDGLSCTFCIIQNNIFENCIWGVGTFGPCIISHNNVTENNVGIGCYFPPHNCTIIANKINGNERGIYLIEDCSPKIHENNIYHNGCGVSYPGYLRVNATMNWWGAVNGPSGNGPGDGDSVGYYIDFEPWLTSPNPNAGR